MHANAILALAAYLSVASAGAIQGFNYAANKPDGSPQDADGYSQLFKNAAALAGTEGAFTSARLYTTIQGGSTNSYSSAIDAAISTKTRLLLGLWASAGQATITNEITALQGAISKYGSKLADLVDGISVGSEDLYRITPTSEAHDPGLVGAGPSDIANYIGQVKKAISGTALSGAKIGHVDTWTAWVNGSNSAVVDACDWIGTDAYPYFESQKSNDISNSKNLFDDAWNQVQSMAKGKPVWVTETGWPTAGKTEGQGVPAVDSAQQYWEAVGCGELFGKVNTWWFTYFDGTPNPTFGLVESVGGQPKYDLSCSKKATISSGSSPTGMSSGTGSSGAQQTGSTVSGGSTSGGSNSGTSGGSSSGSSSSSSSGNGTSSSGGNGTVSSGGSGGVPPAPSSGSGSSGSGSTTPSKGAASTNGACFLGLIGAAIAAVALF